MADKKTKKISSTPSGLLTEVTKYGDRFNFLNDILYYKSDRTVKQYKDMRRYPMNWMGLEFIKLGLPNVPFTIECDDEDPNTKLIIEKVLKRIWKKLIREALEKLDFGFKAMEIRYEKSAIKYKDEEDNTQKFDGILLKSPKGLDGETIKILVEKDDGSFRGFAQHETIEVLVKERKPLLFTNKLESGQYYGISAQEPSFPFWYDANLNRQFHMRWLERKGTGFFKGFYPKGETKVDEAMIDNQQVMLDMLDTIMEGNGIALPSGHDEKGNLIWDIQFMSDQDKTDPFIARAKYIDDMILRSFVIPEKALTQGEVGARASIEAFQDMFILLKQDVLDTVVDTIDMYLLPNFIELNFGKDIEAHVSAGKLDDNSKDVAGKLVEKLVEQSKIKIKTQYLIDKTGIPIEEEEETVEEITPIPGTQGPLTASAPISASAPGSKLTPEEEKKAKKEEEKIKKEKEEAKKLSDMSGNRWRAFNRREEQYNLANLEGELDRRSASFKQEMTEDLTDQVGRIKKYLDKNYTSDGKSVDLARGISVNRNQIKRIIRSYLQDIYKYVYDSVQYGVERTVKFASADTSDSFIRFRVDATTDKFATDFETAIKYQVSSDISALRSKPELLDRIEATLQAFLSTKLNNTAETELGFVLGKGVEDYIKWNKMAVLRGILSEKQEVMRVMYSAVMDSSVCAYCKELDGLVASIDSAVYKRFITPAHYMCRCVWLPVTREEVENPRIIGTDITVTGKGKPVTVEDILSGSSFMVGDEERSVGQLIGLRTFSDLRNPVVSNVCNCGEVH